MSESTNISISNKYPLFVFIILLVLVVILRWVTLYNFCFEVADSDQYVLWAAANDMHHGIFHEPCFYGQAYNPLVEPLLAQPFLFLGFPLRIAMPLVSGILGFLPYVLFSWACFKQKHYITATFALAYLLWLPAEFHVITSIPRGYIPACAIASIGIYLALFNPHKKGIFWFVFLGLTGIVISQNCAFLVVPAAVYLFLTHFKESRFYIQGFAGLLAALPLPLFVYWFYNTHPAYNMHEMLLNFDFDSFHQTMQNTNLWFNFLSPFKSGKFDLILCFYGIFALVCLVKRRFKAFISIIAGLGFFLFTLSFDKTWDGTDSMFFSSVRIFLGVPLSFIVFSFWAESSFQPGLIFGFFRVGLVSIFLVVGLYCCIERISYFNHAGDNYTRHQGIIVSDKVEHTKQLCDQVSSICLQNHSGLVIMDSAMVDVDYMCPALNYPITTIIPDYDRRTWIMQKEDNTIRDNFICIVEDSLKMQKRFTPDIHFKKVNINPPAYLIQTQGRKVFDLLLEMKMDVREY